MAKLKDILGSLSEGEGKDEHPKLGMWREEIAKNQKHGNDVRVVLHRPPDLLGYKPAKLYLQIEDKSGKKVLSDQDEWTAVLDRALVNLGIKAVSKDNEAQRFNLILETSFTQSEERYGDALFNAVFVDYLKDIDSPKLQEILHYSTALNPDKISRSYVELFWFSLIWKTHPFELAGKGK